MKISQNSLQKIKTYVGFAFKAGKAVLGVDNIAKIVKPMLVIYSTELAQNSVKKLNEYSQKFSHQLYEVESFIEISPREGCKAIGIKDNNLADAIIKQLNI
ncbi:MAG: hypothetical protein J6V83_00740 [Clostridia bacterium]|nr:hypothetical protein [Clostridia bacterium]MBO7155911.1 hypothetical protein [Clostridia bacterium]